jgi:nucleoside-diphosphate-sugar epimerase
MCIIGGGGYFGQCIARCLQQQGHDVIIVDIHFGQFDDVIKLDKKHLKTIEVRCHSCKLMSNIIHSTGCICLLSGFVSRFCRTRSCTRRLLCMLPSCCIWYVGWCIGKYSVVWQSLWLLLQLNKHMTYRVNVTGTELAIDACIRHNVKRFIYASTVSVVFHGQPIIDGDETLPYAPFDAVSDRLFPLLRRCCR